jgi:hypothetical protein
VQIRLDLDCREEATQALVAYWERLLAVQSVVVFPAVAGEPVASGDPPARPSPEARS